MEILAWLIPPAGVTLLAMVWATWAGRARRDGNDRSDAAYERFAQAIIRQHPGSGRSRTPVVRDRSTGIAVRPSRRDASRAGVSPHTRRSA